MLSALRKRGIAVEMLTGDRERPAAEHGGQAGIALAGVRRPKEKAGAWAALRKDAIAC